MSRHLLHHLKVRPRLAVALGAGVVAGLAAPSHLAAVTQCLIGWNVMVWLYLLLVCAMMLRADEGHVQRIAAAQSESAATVVTITSVAAIVSLVGVVLELIIAKSGREGIAWPHLGIAFLTVIGSWLLLSIAFALTYATLYYRRPRGGGLNFPNSDPDFEAEYLDFLYFSFTIGVAMQTSDVTVTTTELRRVVLFQQLLAFVFNTSILAFSINTAAGMF